MSGLLDFFEPRLDGTWICVRSLADINAGTVIPPGFRFMDMELIPALEQMAWERDG